ncbi:hypothetical protein C5C18_13900 [Rathayibacter tritici]|nr:serine hydrolase [Rathayibacter tritici]PPF24467.1 hypothetical protein C5C06_13020 [Rathayibacter tritici]PPF63241.1 hypothetical protein C5C21_13305 [Rathayibacter tritici]PPG04106.1 hypothetical protein C5C18_13900 [Rathayibacter tritici]PPI12348.1 hypothetical protein C5D07_13150 [Rathayibacter tritici]PPI42342.1 hypothetical protein C5D18_13335 [Rathayibacter tritici]
MTTSPTTAAAIDLITSSEPVSQDDIDRRLSPAHRIGPASAVLQTVQAIRLSRPRVVRSTRESDQLTAVHVESEAGIAGIVYVQETAEGRLEGLRLVAAVPPLADADDLRGALSDVAGTVSVLIRDGARLDRSGAEVVAGSSLMKLFLLDAALGAVESGEFSLATDCVIRASDISYLSSGLTPAHIGRSVSLRDLCSLMVLRSDNSAADILLRILGAERILATAESHGLSRALNTPLLSTRDYYRRAWGAAADPAADHATVDALLRANALEDIRYPDGLDYFVTPESIDSVMRRLSERPWTPWLTENRWETAPIIQFKGGSAPGVLAGSWLLVTPDSVKGLTFCLNGDQPLGAIEEVYAFACAEAVLSTGDMSRSDGTRGI